MQTQRIERDDDGIRLDRWFKRHYPALTHGRLEKLLRTGQVRLDGKRVKASDRLAEGQMLRRRAAPVSPSTSTACWSR